MRLAKSKLAWPCATSLSISARRSRGGASDSLAKGLAAKMGVFANGYHFLVYDCRGVPRDARGRPRHLVQSPRYVVEHPRHVRVLGRSHRGRGLEHVRGHPVDACRSDGYRCSRPTSRPSRNPQAANRRLGKCSLASLRNSSRMPASVAFPSPVVSLTNCSSGQSLHRPCLAK